MHHHDCENFGHPCWLDDSYTHWGWTWDSHLCHCSNIIVRLNGDVHQAHKELNAGWGNMTDFQLCNKIFQFPVQWYDFHRINIIYHGDKFSWWVLMFGYLQLRKQHHDIILSDKLCGKEFSLKGVKCKKWDLDITCFWRNLTYWLDEASQLFFAHEFMLQFSYMVDKFAALQSAFS